MGDWRLEGHQGLRLRLEVLLRLGLDVLRRRGGEVLRLVGLGGGLRDDLGRARAAPNHLLSLGGVVAHVLLGDLGGLGGVLLGSGPQLGGLGVDDIGRLLELVVNQLLVAGVDKRHEEGGRGGDKGETPVGDDLDEVVRYEGTEERLEKY